MWYYKRIDKAGKRRMNKNDLMICWIQLAEEPSTGYLEAIYKIFARLIIVSMYYMAVSEDKLDKL